MNEDKLLNELRSMKKELEKAKLLEIDSKPVVSVLDIEFYHDMVQPDLKKKIRKLITKLTTDKNK